MAHHDLKSDPEGFQAVWDRRKTHEMRYDDRNFKVGDVVQLLETRHSVALMAYSAVLYPLDYTGRNIIATVSHIQHGYGLKPGWVLLSLVDVLKVDHQDL